MVKLAAAAPPACVVALTPRHGDARSCVRRRAGLRWAGLLAVSVIGACDPGGVACPLGFGPTIEVHVRDGAGQPAATGASGTARYDSGSDSLYPGDSLTMLVWTNRPGRYALTVGKDGFVPWDTTDVLVQSTGGPCPGVVGVAVEAVLRAVP